MSSLSLATRFAAKLSESRSIDSLRAVWLEVNASRKELTKEDYDWVKCFKDSRKLVLSTPELCEDDFNEKGKEWARYNGILPQK